MSDVTLHEATTAEDLSAVRRLCWAYHDFLRTNSDIDRQITDTFYPAEKYQRLMDDLPREHARPGGFIMLARRNGAPAGCGMIRKIDAQTAEIKRVYVDEAARGAGVAARLCRALMDQARIDGYTAMVLDTSTSLIGAQRLYERLGFHQRGPYQPIPPDVLPHLMFYETTL